MRSTTQTRWALPEEHARVRHLRHKHAMTEPTARLVALLAYGEGRQ